jgi:gliding motility-associated-like protein
VSFNIVANDTDADGTVDVATVDLDPSTVGIQTTFANASGSWSVNSSGVLTYTPTADFNGTASITYKVNDNSGATSNAATVTITVNAVNDPPVAVNDNSSTNEDTPVSFNITTNDTDVDGTINAASVDLDPSTVGIQTTFSNASGSWSVNSSGVLTYTPSVDFNGTASIDYVVNDNSGATSNVATVTITVNPVNDPPVAVNDNSSTNEDTPVSFNIVANDTDADGTVDVATVDLDPSTVGIQTTFANASGSWSVNSSGSLTYTPAADFTGSASIDYTVNDNNSATSNAATVTITVNPVNDPPVAINDNSSTNEDTPVSFNITTNDTDVDGTINAASVDLDPSTAGVQSTFTNASGSWSVNSSGVLTYTPAVDFNGTASIDYVVNDNSGATSNVATVTITVNPVNDPPVAVNDNSSTNEDTPVSFNIVANDTDADGTVDVATVDLDPSTAGFQSTFTNASGTWNVSNTGTLTYTPVTGFKGSASITYTVNDNHGTTSNAATITVAVGAVNHPPVLTDLNLTTNEDVPLTSSVFDPADNDPEGSNLTVVTTPVSQPSHGSVVINTDGSFTYTPSSNYSGADVFTVQICDSGSPQLCTTKSIAITVIPVNDPPVANDNISSTTKGVAVSGTLADNDLDVDGTLVYTTTPVQAPAHGSIVINVDGSYVYTPADGFTGTDEVTIQVCDNGSPSLCTTEKLTIHVLPDNNVAPVAKNDEKSTNAGVAIVIHVLDNDAKGTSEIDPTTVDLDPGTPGIQHTLIISGKGTLATDSEGNIEFVPEEGFTGTVDFTYTVSDINGTASNVATVAITVAPALPEGVVIPNAFSPNNDGANDLFIIEGADQYVVALYVYNRWGNIVYANKDYKNTWSGIGNNVQDPDNKTKISAGSGDMALPAGTYFYVVEFSQDKSKRFTGFVELRR